MEKYNKIMRSFLKVRNNEKRRINKFSNHSTKLSDLSALGRYRKLAKTNIIELFLSDNKQILDKTEYLSEKLLLGACKSIFKREPNIKIVKSLLNEHKNKKKPTKSNFQAKLTELIEIMEKSSEIEAVFEAFSVDVPFVEA